MTIRTVETCSGRDGSHTTDGSDNGIHWFVFDLLNYVGIFSHLFGELINAGEPLGSRNGGGGGWGGVSVRRRSAKFTPFARTTVQKGGRAVSQIYNYYVLRYKCLITYQCK